MELRIRARGVSTEDSQKNTQLGSKVDVHKLGGNGTVLEKELEETEAGMSVVKETLDKRVWQVALSSFMMGTAIGVVMPIMPLFVQKLDISVAEFGVIVAVMGGARIVANIPSAWFAERFGRTPLMIGGPLLTAFGMAATALATSFQQLVTLRVITGVGGSMQMSGSQLYLADISSSHNRARTMAPLMASFSAGAVAGPALGGFLADSYGLETPFYFVGAAIFAVALNNYTLPETKTWQAHEPVELGVGSLLREFATTGAQWRPLLASRDVSSVVLLHGAYWTVSAGCMWTLMPLLASDTFGLSASQLGTVFIVQSGINIAGSQPAAWLSDKYGRKTTIVPACVLLAGGALLLPHATSLEQFSAVWVAWSCGATLMAAGPVSYISDVSTPAERGQALAMLRSAGDLGLMLGAGGFGAVAQLCSPHVAYTLGAAMITGAGANFALRANEPRKDAT